MLETETVDDGSQTRLTENNVAPKPLTDTHSAKLQPSATLGQPLGCLRIAGNADSNRLRQQIAVWLAATVGVVAAFYMLSQLQVHVGRGVAKAIAILAVVVVAGITIYGFKLASRTARVVDVFQNGLRYNDPRDAFDSRLELPWDQFDKQFNRVVYQTDDEVLNDELRQVTFKLRLHGAAINSKSHQLSLYVRTPELQLARFIADQLNCAEI